MERVIKSWKYLIIFFLIIIVLFIVGSLMVNYNVKPNEAFIVDKGNLIEDGSFENFNKTVGDCCTTPEKANQAKIFAFRTEDSIIGTYGLQLMSQNHCACSSFSVDQFDKKNIYLGSFYYKGDSPRFCNWVGGDNVCLMSQKLTSNSTWSRYQRVLSFTNNSDSLSVFFYADSDGTKTVTNLYDDLQVRKLGRIGDYSNYNFKANEEYVIKTKADNVVHNGERISEIDAQNEEAYFLVKGRPNVTIQFPWSEIIIILIIVAVIVRLMFKKNENFY